VPQAERTSGFVYEKAQEQPKFVLHYPVGKLAIRWHRQSVHLDELSEIDVPNAFICKLDIYELKFSAIPEAGRDIEAPKINHAHGEE
jgi:hypothetical protein